MLNFNSLLIFSENPADLASFYMKVFDKKPEMEMEGYTGFQVGTGWITIGPHDKVKGKSTNPERIMFNLETEDVKGEFDRVKRLGASVIAEPYGDEEKPMEEGGGLVATFADPDRNYFQLMSPMPSGQN